MMLLSGFPPTMKLKFLEPIPCWLSFSKIDLLTKHKNQRGHLMVKCMLCGMTFAINESINAIIKGNIATYL